MRHCRRFWQPSGGGNAAAQIDVRAAANLAHGVARRPADAGLDDPSRPHARAHHQVPQCLSITISGNTLRAWRQLTLATGHAGKARCQECPDSIHAVQCARFMRRRLEETEMLLAAQRDVNRGLDNDVHKLMAQLEDLNRRYASLGRRTAGLQARAAATRPPQEEHIPSNKHKLLESLNSRAGACCRQFRAGAPKPSGRAVQDELATAASGDFQALRQRLRRAEAANSDLEQVQRRFFDGWAACPLTLDVAALVAWTLSTMPRVERPD